MTENWNPINNWNKNLYEDRLESVNDGIDGATGSKLSGDTNIQHSDIEQLSHSNDEQNLNSRPQREPVEVHPSDFGGYGLQLDQTQDSNLKSGSEDMVSRVPPTCYDVNKLKSHKTAPPTYQEITPLTHDKNIDFFGDSNFAGRTSRSTLDQDSLHRGSISTLPSAGQRRGSSQKRRASSLNTNEASHDRKSSLVDMAVGAVGTVGAAGAAAATGVSNALLGGTKPSPTEEESKEMPSSWPSLSESRNLHISGNRRTQNERRTSHTSNSRPTNNETRTSGITKNDNRTSHVTKLTVEPAIHGQSACYHTKDNVCDEITKDSNHPFCERIQEPILRGQNPSFYGHDENTELNRASSAGQTAKARRWSEGWSHEKSSRTNDIFTKGLLATDAAGAAASSGKAERSRLERNHVSQSSTSQSGASQYSTSRRRSSEILGMASSEKTGKLNLETITSSSLHAAQFGTTRRRSSNISDALLDNRSSTSAATKTDDSNTIRRLSEHSKLHEDFDQTIDNAPSNDIKSFKGVLAAGGGGIAGRGLTRAQILSQPEPAQDSEDDDLSTDSALPPTWGDQPMPIPPRHPSDVATNASQNAQEYDGIRVRGYNENQDFAHQQPTEDNTSETRLSQDHGYSHSHDQDFKSSKGVLATASAAAIGALGGLGFGHRAHNNLTGSHDDKYYNSNQDFDDSVTGEKTTGHVAPKGWLSNADEGTATPPHHWSEADQNLEPKGWSDANQSLPIGIGQDEKHDEYVDRNLSSKGLKSETTHNQKAFGNNQQQAFGSGSAFGNSAAHQGDKSTFDYDSYDDEVDKKSSNKGIIAGTVGAAAAAVGGLFGINSDNKETDIHQDDSTLVDSHHNKKATTTARILNGADQENHEIQSIGGGRYEYNQADSYESTANSRYESTLDNRYETRQENRYDRNDTHNKSNKGAIVGAAAAVGSALGLDHKNKRSEIRDQSSNYDNDSTSRNDSSSGVYRKAVPQTTQNVTTAPQTLAADVQEDSIGSTSSQYGSNHDNYSSASDNVHQNKFDKGAIAGAAATMGGILGLNHENKHSEANQGNDLSSDYQNTGIPTERTKSIPTLPRDTDRTQQKQKVTTAPQTLAADVQDDSIGSTGRSHETTEGNGINRRSSVSDNKSGKGKIAGAAATIGGILGLTHDNKQSEIKQDGYQTTDYQDVGIPSERTKSVPTVPTPPSNDSTNVFQKEKTETKPSYGYDITHDEHIENGHDNKSNKGIIAGATGAAGAAAATVGSMLGLNHSNENPETGKQSQAAQYEDTNIPSMRTKDVPGIPSDYTPVKSDQDKKYGISAQRRKSVPSIKQYDQDDAVHTSNADVQDSRYNTVQDNNSSANKSSHGNNTNQNMSGKGIVGGAIAGTAAAVGGILGSKNKKTDPVTDQQATQSAEDQEYGISAERLKSVPGIPSKTVSTDDSRYESVKDRGQNATDNTANSASGLNYKQNETGQTYNQSSDYANKAVPSERLKSVPVVPQHNDSIPVTQQSNQTTTKNLSSDVQGNNFESYEIDATKSDRLRSHSKSGKGLLAGSVAALGGILGLNHSGEKSNQSTDNNYNDNNESKHVSDNQYESAYYKGVDPNNSNKGAIAGTAGAAGAAAATVGSVLGVKNKSNEPGDASDVLRRQGSTSDQVNQGFTTSQLNQESNSTSQGNKLADSTQRDQRFNSKGTTVDQADQGFTTSYRDRRINSQQDQGFTTTQRDQQILSQQNHSRISNVQCKSTGLNNQSKAAGVAAMTGIFGLSMYDQSTSGNSQNNTYVGAQNNYYSQHDTRTGTQNSSYAQGDTRTQDYAQSNNRTHDYAQSDSPTQNNPYAQRNIDSYARRNTASQDNSYATDRKSSHPGVIADTVAAATAAAVTVGGVLGLSHSDKKENTQQSQGNSTRDYQNTANTSDGNNSTNVQKDYGGYNNMSDCYTSDYTQDNARDNNMSDCYNSSYGHDDFTRGRNDFARGNNTSDGYNSTNGQDDNNRAYRENTSAQRDQDITTAPQSLPADTQYGQSTQDQTTNDSYANGSAADTQYGQSTQDQTANDSYANGSATGNQYGQSTQDQTTNDSYANGSATGNQYGQSTQDQTANDSYANGSATGNQYGQSTQDQTANDSYANGSATGNQYGQSTQDQTANDSYANGSATGNQYGQSTQDQTANDSYNNVDKTDHHDKGIIAGTVGAAGAAAAAVGGMLGLHDKNKVHEDGVGKYDSSVKYQDHAQPNHSFPSKHDQEIRNANQTRIVDSQTATKSSYTTPGSYTNGTSQNRNGVAVGTAVAGGATAAAAGNKLGLNQKANESKNWAENNNGTIHRGETIPVTPKNDNIITPPQTLANGQQSQTQTSPIAPQSRDQTVTDQNQGQHGTSTTQKGLMTGGLGAAGAAGATALGSRNNTSESISSTRATTGKIVPDSRNQEIKDRHYENFKNTPNSIDDLNNPKRRNNSITQGFKSRFSNVVRRLSGQSGGSSHERRLSDAEVYKNQQQITGYQQAAFGGGQQAFGGGTAFGKVAVPVYQERRQSVQDNHHQEPKKSVQDNHTPLNRTEPNAGSRLDHVHTEASPIHDSHETPRTGYGTVHRIDTSDCPRHYNIRQTEPTSSQNTHKAQYIQPSTAPRQENVQNSDSLRDRYPLQTASSNDPEHLKYTGVNKEYARIPGVYSLKPAGTVDVDENGEINFVKVNEGTKAVGNIAKVEAIPVTDAAKISAYRANQ